MPISGKQLFNASSEVVIQNIEALCQQNADLQYLEGFPEVKVVLRSVKDRGRQVSVISGGGAGHEPAHAGYIGSGMLAAAVVGDLFASPSAASIVHAVRAVTGSSGCLFIVKNYTGDRLNFGLAAELAKAEGFKVEVVIVGDDCALPGTGLAGRRGIAGTIFVHKIAGAAAASGLSLAEVRNVAQEAAVSIGSMGVATQICKIPGEKPPRGLGHDEVEMGLGIHGEPGAYKRSMASADELVKEVSDKILGYTKWPGQDKEYALLVNNLGTTSALEMGVLLKSATEYLKSKQVKVVRVYCGTFMTSTDMSGFSISLLQLKEEWKQYLDLPVKVAAWPNVSSIYSNEAPAVPIKESNEESFQQPASLSDFGRTAEACLHAVASALIDSAAQLDEWDRSVGDGDCGTTVKRGALAIQEALQRKEMPLNDAASLCRCLARCVSAMGGTSGAVYNIFFTAAAGALPKEGPATAQQASQAVAAGVDKIMFYGGAKAGNRTMLDAILPASEALRSALVSGESGKGPLAKAAQAADAGAEATRKMAAGAGRSSYIPKSELADVPDPGAKVVSIWLGAISSEA